jgi:hypothetical protein
MTVALLAVAMPASAAVTLRGLFLDGTPRAAWLERYSEARQGPEQVDTIQQTYKVGDGAVLDLSQISGDIRVTGGSGSEVRIEATKRVRHRDPAEARRLLNELRVDVNNFNDRIEVRTLYPRRGGRGNNISASVDYVIAVPSSASVALRAISGDVTVMQVAGEVRAETVSGDVHVTATPNLAVAKTISGDVIARDIGTRLSLVLSTVSGTVSASGLKARTLEAASVSGDVRLAATEVERVEANSVSGNIEFDAPLVKGGRYQFTSHSGNVRVLLSNSTGFELDADTFAGSVRSDVPVTLRSMGRTERDRRGSSRAIRGTYGDASALLIVRSHSGSVVITKK